jgi:hypothetical protein
MLLFLLLQLFPVHSSAPATIPIPFPAPVTNLASSPPDDVALAPPTPMHVPSTAPATIPITSPVPVTNLAASPFSNAALSSPTIVSCPFLCSC